MRVFLAAIVAVFLLAGCVAYSVPDLDYGAISNKIVVLGDLQDGHGSGVIISPDGRILTNAHVVDDLATNGEINVQFKDGSNATAKIVWVAKDGAGGVDLAEVKIENPTKSYPFAVISTEPLFVGQPVFHIGNPQFFGWTVTWGHISAFHRDLSSVDVAADLIQTDLSVSNGSSGGGVFDSSGELVGLVNADYPKNQSMSFAVARETIVKQLALHGE